MNEELGLYRALAGAGPLTPGELAHDTNTRERFVRHDMGDPVGAARHVLGSLAPDGTWSIVEPFANDRVEENLNPVGRVYYGASTTICNLVFEARP